MRLEPGDEGYDVIFAYWKIEGGAVLNYAGADWLVLRDNDKMVFVRTGSASGFDNKYSGSSIPMK